MDYSEGTLTGVIDVLVRTLGIPGQVELLQASTPMFDSMPEFDSMAVVAVSVALEREFGIEIDDEDLTGEVFETIGSLAAFVENAQCPRPLSGTDAR